MEIGFIGFGEAARAFHATLVAHAPSLAFAAYDVLLEREGANGPCAAAMRERSVRIAAGPAVLARSASWVISAVTSDQSAAAAVALAPHLRAGQVYFEINSVAPERKRANCRLIEESGADYIDMAVMAPVHPRGHRTPVLIAGRRAGALAPALQGLDFSFAIGGTEAGAAAAVKMIRSLFVKGLEALTVETLLAAEAAGCLEDILRSIDQSYPGLGGAAFADYQFERTSRHGLRRAAEIEECAATLGALDRSRALAEAIAAAQRRMGEADPRQQALVAAVRARLAADAAAPPGDRTVLRG